MREKELTLLHFNISGDLDRRFSIEKKLENINGVESVDILPDENLIYISFDSEMVSIDSIIEILNRENLKII